MPSLISPTILASLQANFGPQASDGQAFVSRQGTPVRDGAGWKLGAETLTLYPCRATFMPYQRVHITPIADEPGGEHRYLIELPVTADVLVTDIIKFAAPDWVASQAFLLGQTCLPITRNGCCYMASVAGTSGATEPDWTSAPTYDSTLIDGTVTWTNVGPYVVMHITEVQEAQTYSLCKDVYCEVRS